MISIGTCSWSEKTLIQSKEFYPPGVNTAEGRLRFYADHFSVVEVDSSYYGIPAMETAALWADRTPHDFVFHIKAYAAITGHGIDPRSLPRDLQTLLTDEERTKKYVYVKDAEALKEVAKRFRDNLQPLIVSKKIGVVVFQYPPWFQYGHRNLDYIAETKELMGDLAIAVEFRHGSWLLPERREALFRFLEEHGLNYVVADEPQYGDLRTIPYAPEITGDVAYFRFHGRNAENWLKKGIETALRYAYEYSDEELEAFIPSIRKVDEKAKNTYLMFNNCYMASAIKNALRMRDLMTQRGQA